MTLLILNHPDKVLVMSTHVICILWRTQIIVIKYDLKLVVQFYRIIKVCHPKAPSDCNLFCSGWKMCCFIINNCIT